jgi:hypothetical protein
MSLRVTQVAVVFFLQEFKNFQGKESVNETMIYSDPLQIEVEDHGNISRQKT